MSTTLSQLAGRPSPGDEFAAEIDAHRRDLILLAYRFLGSIAEAEEAAQETTLRAWRARDRFRGEASMRTWLHRIAARVCLDLLRARRGRMLPQAVRPPADPGAAPEPALTEVQWLEPVPNEVFAGVAHDPAARYDLRESVSLAFIAALQSLPARQRAVLLLRDVLGWRAVETAAALDMSVPAANSALHRARVAMRETHHVTGLAAVPDRPPSDAVARRLLDSYVRAWASDDVAGLLATMREDVRLAMPPSPTWFDGRPAVESALRTWVFDVLRPTNGYRVAATSANGQPAALFGPAGDGVAPPHFEGVQVLNIDPDGRVALVTVFLDPGVAARFGAAGSSPRR
jgi:RNA polymerase sigma-70 factor (ECF subfamily)